MEYFPISCFLPYIFISTILYTIPSNLLSSDEIRLNDISLLDSLDPTTKFFESGSLDYPSLNSNRPYFRKVKMCGSEQGSYCFLAANRNYRQSGIHVVCNAPENSKTERGGLNFVDPEK